MTNIQKFSEVIFFSVKNSDFLKNQGVEFLVSLRLNLPESKEKKFLSLNFLLKIRIKMTPSNLILNFFNTKFFLIQKTQPNFF